MSGGNSISRCFFFFAFLANGDEGEKFGQNDKEEGMLAPGPSLLSQLEDRTNERVKVERKRIRRHRKSSDNRVERTID